MPVLPPCPQYMATVFGVLAVCPGLVAVVLFLCGSWYDAAGSLEKSTIGNYGLVSSTNGSSALGALLLSDSSISSSQASGLVSFTSAKSEPRRWQGFIVVCLCVEVTFFLSSPTILVSLRHSTF